MQRLTNLLATPRRWFLGYTLLFIGICQIRSAESVFSQKPQAHRRPIGPQRPTKRVLPTNPPRHRAVEPAVLGRSDEGQRQIATFRVPDGMNVELFAAEPEVANPVAFCFDEQGRMLVAETFRQNKGVEDNRAHINWLDDDLAAHTVDDRLAMFKKFLGKDIAKYAEQTDRIRMLLDTKGTGHADKSIIVADGFNGVLDGTGAGSLVHGGDLYYTCIPNLWKLSGISENIPAEHREILHSGYGVHVAFLGHDMHGLIIGPDGKLYFSIGDRGLHVKVGDRDFGAVYSGSVLRCDLDGSDLESSRPACAIRRNWHSTITAICSRATTTPTPATRHAGCKLSKGVIAVGGWRTNISPIVVRLTAKKSGIRHSPGKRRISCRRSPTWRMVPRGWCTIRGSGCLRNIVGRSFWSISAAGRLQRRACHPRETQRRRLRIVQR